MAEFTDHDKRLGQSMGRLESSEAFEDYWYALTDEEMGVLDVDIQALPYAQISQSVDVTSLSGITLRVKWQSADDVGFAGQNLPELVVSLASQTVYSETIPAEDTERGPYIVTIPCAKLTGSQSLVIKARVI